MKLTLLKTNANCSFRWNFEVIYYTNTSCSKKISTKKEFDSDKLVFLYPIQKVVDFDSFYADHPRKKINIERLSNSAQYNDLVPNGENCLNTVLLLCYNACEIINCILTLKKNCISMAKQHHFIDVNSTLKVNVEIRLPPKAFLLLCYDTDIHTLS